MEMILCIQIYSTNIGLVTWLTWSILGLFAVNALLFLVIGIILFQRREERRVTVENSSNGKRQRKW